MGFCRWNMKKESDFTPKMYQSALRNMSKLLKRSLEEDAVSEKEKRMAEDITRIILDNPDMESDKEAPLQEWQVRELEKLSPLYDKCMAVEKRKNSLKRVAKGGVAAMLASAMVGFAFSYFQNSPEEQTDGGNSHTDLVAMVQNEGCSLPDGSTGLLEKGSCLKQAENYNKDERRVELTGRARFDVKKGQPVPFISEGVGISAHVKGTVYDMCAYPDVDVRQLTVLEGVVEVRSMINKSGAQRKDTLLATLHVGQQITFDTKTYECSFKRVDTDRASAWTKGRDLPIRLSNMSLLELKMEMRKQYGAILEVEDGIFPEECRITAPLTSERDGITALDVVERICTLYPGTEYKEEGNRIVISR